MSDELCRLVTELAEKHDTSIHTHLAFTPFIKEAACGDRAGPGQQSAAAAEGDPNAILNDPAVIEAYLGSEDAAA